MLKENFVEMLQESIKKNWNLPAFSDYKESSITYGETAEKIIWLHHVFKKMHIKVTCTSIHTILVNIGIGRACCTDICNTSSPFHF